ncbi:hypothetical protein L218DRAFT_1006940 [Marasmius fiardii PR-910]|nr:hypothetical protein L218DRAFT_1006940 [Marasmius fiardii PR-910]
MRLLSEAWDEVSAETIQNCWRHSGVVPNDDTKWEDLFISNDALLDSGVSDIEMCDNTQSVWQLPSSWGIISKCATSNWTLPFTEKKLKDILGEAYNPDHWSKALYAVAGVKSTKDAVAAVEALILTCQNSHSHSMPQPAWSNTNQLVQSENELKEVVTELYNCGCLQDLSEIDDLLDPPIEHEDLDSVEMDNFADGDKGLQEIKDYVKRK